VNIKIIGPAAAGSAGPVPTQMHPTLLCKVTAVMTNEQLAYVSALLPEADIVCTKRRSNSI